MAVPTLAARISESFTAWECRGRGWQKSDYTVALEPPYRPFFLLPLAESSRVPLDDGLRPTVLSELGKAVQSLFVHEPGPPETEARSYEEQAPFPLPTLGDISTRYLLIDSDFSSSVEIALEVLRVLASGFRPVAFEVMGYSGVVIVQIACDAADAEQVFAMLEAYLPDIAFVDGGDGLLQAWGAYTPSLVVDYGYADEFFLPLSTVSSFRIDPYLPLVTALARTREQETLCFQVLIEKTVNPWRRAILDAVTASDGKSLFSDAPEFIPLAREKTAGPLLAVAIRVGASATSAERALDLVRGLQPFMTQFERPGGNALIPLSNQGYGEKEHATALLGRVSYRTGMILSAAELAGLVHVPDRSVTHDALLRSERRTKALPRCARGHPFVLGENLHRGDRAAVTLDIPERLAHTMLIGASGTGKSTLLVNLIRQDMEQRHGCAVLDPHGDLIDDVLRQVPRHRHDDVVVFDPADEAYPVGFNILHAASEREKILLASDLVGIFQRLSTSWGDSMSTVLANAVLAMLESPDGGTLLHLRRFLVDDRYRKAFLQTVTDPEVQFFWQKEWPLIGARSIGPLLSRINAFLRPKLIRQIVGQKQPKLHFSSLMNERKIVLLKLSQGLIGNENAYLLGSLLLSTLLQSALARQSIAKDERRPFFLYVDEAEHFVTPSIASFLTESRKYGVGVHLAFQTLSQLRAVPQVASAVLGNCHTRILFRVGDEDARTLADGLSFFEAKDLKSLGRGEAIVRIGEVTNDCNLRTHPMPLIDVVVAEARRELVLARSRQQYATDQATVAQELDELRQGFGGEVTEPEPEKVKAEPAAAPHPPPPAPAPPGTETPVAPKREALTLQARPASTPPPLPGRGSEEHKYLQHLIKRLGEERGFRAVIEESVAGGQVDVALRRQEVSIACEVSVTTSTEHELDNLRKCVDTGFTQVWLVVPDAKRRNRLTKAVSAFGTRVRCLAGEDLVAAFEVLAPTVTTQERIVGGYKVKATRKMTSYEDYEKRQAAIADVIARSILKRKKKE